MEDIFSPSLSVLAFVACEHIHYHSDGSISLIGMYHPKREMVFDGQIGSFHVFFEFTDFSGIGSFVLAITTGDTDDIVLRHNVWPTFRCDDPRKVNQISWEITSKGFQDTGEYHLQLQVDDVALARRRLQIVIAEKETDV